MCGDGTVALLVFLVCIRNAWEAVTTTSLLREAADNDCRRQYQYRENGL